MRMRRASGILLHPTSLPGPFGIGDLGPSAIRFLDFLTETGQHWWQILPTGPTGAGNSPYQSHSSFAGNPLLISPERLVEQGLLVAAELPESVAEAPGGRIDFRAVEDAKLALLRKAFTRFKALTDHKDFHAFADRNRWWLDDFAHYMALKAVHSGAPWYEWEHEIVVREPAALDASRREHGEEMYFHQFVQFLFDKQWNALRLECKSRNIKLIGDVPIYVSGDSTDVWANPQLFYLDDRGRPTVVAGVPPDLFSPEDGQRWGNPLYNWPAHREQGYSWWVARMYAVLERVDLIRLDHFRGFEAYWEIPAHLPTAALGRWVEGPGGDLLGTLRDRLGGLPLIAEDLGIITEGVEALRDGFQLPGMRILQFAFSAGPEDAKFLPHCHIPHCVVYTGTHDNDTTVGWFEATQERYHQPTQQLAEERAFARRYLGSSNLPVHWQMNRAALGSVADTVILPLQDVMGLDHSARMNVPGEAEGHWGWRFRWEQLKQEDKDRLAEATMVYARWNGPLPETLQRPEYHAPQEGATTLPHS